MAASRSSRNSFNVDGAAYLFNGAVSPYRIIAVSTTGCVAVQASDEDVRVFYWWYRSTGKEPIVIEPVPWIRIWSCASPKDRQPAGYLTRLHCDGCELTDLHADSLRQLAHLRCRHNHLRRLICSRMEHLRTLDCTGNALSSLEVDGCYCLDRLMLGGNPGLPRSGTEYASLARGNVPPPRRRSLTATSLFDL